MGASQGRGKAVCALTMASVCCRPMMAAVKSPKLSSLPKNFGGLRFWVRQKGHCGMHRYLHGCIW